MLFHLHNDIRDEFLKLLYESLQVVAHRINYTTYFVVERMMTEDGDTVAWVGGKRRNYQEAYRYFTKQMLAELTIIPPEARYIWLLELEKNYGN